jgi:hypothetical protein
LKEFIVTGVLINWSGQSVISAFQLETKSTGIASRIQTASHSHFAKNDPLFPNQPDKEWIVDRSLIKSPQVNWP